MFCEERLLNGIRFSGGNLRGCRLAFFLPLGSGCALTLLGGADGPAGNAGTALVPEIPLVRVFVLLCPARSTERFLGVSAGVSKLVLGVGRNFGAGIPAASPDRVVSPRDESEKPDCELLNDDEKNG